MKETDLNSDDELLHIHLKTTKIQMVWVCVSLSRNHDPVTEDNPQTLLGTVSWRNHFFSVVG